MGLGPAREAVDGVRRPARLSLEGGGPRGDSGRGKEGRLTRGRGTAGLGPTDLLKLIGREGVGGAVVTVGADVEDRFVT